jgi:hypothetical protein
MIELEAVTARLRNTFSYTYTPLGTPVNNGGWTPATWSDTSTTRGHKRKLNASSFIPARRQRWTWYAVVSTTLVALWVLFLYKTQFLGSDSINELVEDNKNHELLDSEQPAIAIGQSIEWNGREVFWWEQFRKFKNYSSGWQNIVPYNEYVPEQRGDATTSTRGSPLMVQLNPYVENGRNACSLDNGTPLPSLLAYNGLPQGMPAPLFGSHEELGLRADVCYDRINRYGPYGLGYDESIGGLGINMKGDNSGIDTLYKHDYRGVKWGDAQQKCRNQNSHNKLPRTAFVLRVWHDLKYTPHRIMMLRAIMAELSLASGGQYEIQFLIDVHDETIPIWADEAVYNETLKNALPEEFAGMGTLWSVPQMRTVYPGPFDEYINFSGGDLHTAYRSLHFSMQYFASQHPEYDYFWNWEIDLRVTGHYYELLDRITKWAEKQSRDHLWERNERFFIPPLYHNSYSEFSAAVTTETAATNTTAITGPQLPTSSLFPIPLQNPPSDFDSTSTTEIVDLISLNPIFNPSSTHWAFRDDITGYNLSYSPNSNTTSSNTSQPRPPTRATLITATRLSRRLLTLMHQETYLNHHTMFPEMYPASIALHYGLKAVSVPLPIYFDHDFSPEHANEVFNNAPLSEASEAAGMDHGGGRFHGLGGSVFGPGEHVFRGATYYSNAAFGGYLWRAWLGGEGMEGREGVKLGEVVSGKGGNAAGEQPRGTGGRMCLPMMVLHPVKYESEL